MLLTDDLTIKTDHELAKWHAEAKGRPEYEILAEQELKRRERTQEHKRQLPKPWSETFIGKVIVGVIIGVLVIIAGIFIGKYLNPTPRPQQFQQPQQSPAQQQEPQTRFSQPATATHTPSSVNGQPVGRDEAPQSDGPVNIINKCSNIMANRDLVVFSPAEDEPWSKGWRRWDWVKTGLLYAKEQNSAEVLVYELQKDKNTQAFYRFRTQQDSVLHFSRFPSDAVIKIGPCWKKVKEMPRKSYKSPTDGKTYHNDKTIIYVLTKN